MAAYKAGETVPAASHDTAVTINGTTNTIREFIRCGAIRTTNGQFLYVGGSDLIGNMAVGIDSTSNVI
ncbi:MAG TPA: hypothetical protein VJ654_07600 [Noviherbaspirillum sp.]|nr:hypothetical protein [Noviherbaspirillum sp.]